jgi:hypothetical protein
MLPYYDPKTDAGAIALQNEAAFWSASADISLSLHNSGDAFDSHLENALHDQEFSSHLYAIVRRYMEIS